MVLINTVQYIVLSFSDKKLSDYTLYNNPGAFKGYLPWDSSLRK